MRMHLFTRTSKSSCAAMVGIPASRFLESIRNFCIISSLVVLSACSDNVNLQSGLSDADANEIVSVLNRNGIEARKNSSKDGVVLTVKGTDISRATDVMHAAGLPHRTLSNLGQVFKKEGMISTPLEERVRYIHGLSQELENTLQQFDNVVSARVHVVLPERIAPGEPIQPSSAAVFVKYRQPFDEDINVPRIRNMVASSIPGLSGPEGRNKVSVVLTPTELAPPGIEWVNVGPFTVQAGSATSLTSTLVILVMLAGGSAAWAGSTHKEKIIAMLKKHSKRAPAPEEAEPEANAPSEERPAQEVS